MQLGLMYWHVEMYKKKLFCRHKNFVMFRPKMWSQGWPKHVAACCLYKIISIYIYKCAGSITLQIQLTHESFIK